MTDITTEPTSAEAATSPTAEGTEAPPAPEPAKKAARKRAPRKKAVAAAPDPSSEPVVESTAGSNAESNVSLGAVSLSTVSLGADEPTPDAPVPVKKPVRKRASRAKKVAEPALEGPSDPDSVSAELPVAPVPADPVFAEPAEPVVAPTRPVLGAPLLFQAPEPEAPRRRRRAQAPAGPPTSQDEAPSITEGQSPTDSADVAVAGEPTEPAAEAPTESAESNDGTETGRKRRRRGGRGRRGRADEESVEQTTDSPDSTDDAEPAVVLTSEDEAAAGDQESEDESGSSSSRRRRRRRRRAGSADAVSDDPPGTVTKVRQPRRPADDEVTSIKGSTRLEAKKQRRRDGRDAGRRKPIITESEFLARRESVERTMIVRDSRGRTQIAVLEDDVLVEHYVANESNASMIGNVYLGRVQNVLPSMEAAFIDIGKGRNAVLYAGEVNWDAAGLEGGPRRIEVALKSGDQVLTQVTKDPMGHKGARLTSQVSLPGRYLVYVPNGSMTGISRKLPDTERARLKKILKSIVPEGAGVIVRTAAEGASEEELQRDVERLAAQWNDIEKRAGSSAGGSAPKLLHGEPDLTVRVIRDVFNEDFAKLVVSGGAAGNVVQQYVESVAADLSGRISKWTSQDDVFAAYRVDEQLTKAMDRKVWLPSGGSLVIDRTEAMTVVDVNTGKFTGAGGNLEETVTRNNLEAAEEMVRQLRLRDIGGIIVVDFIDMVLESNRDLVMRRLLECLGRDRTKHQVAEVTSLGLVQMTRKRVGQGLLEVFSESCEACNGRGILLHADPIQTKGEGGSAASGALGAGSQSRSEGKGEQPPGGRTRSGRNRAKTAETPPQPNGEADSAPPPRQPIPAGLVASLAHHQPETPDAAPPVTSEVPVEDSAAPVVPDTSPEPTNVDLTATTPEESARPARRRRRASAPSGPPPSQA